jgi:hypothetical protein
MLCAVRKIYSNLNTFRCSINRQPKQSPVATMIAKPVREFPIPPEWWIHKIDKTVSCPMDQLNAVNLGGLMYVHNAGCYFKSVNKF